MKLRHHQRYREYIAQLKAEREARLGSLGGTSRGLNVKDERPLHVLIVHRAEDLGSDEFLAGEFENLRSSWGAVKKENYVSRVVVQNHDVRARARVRAAVRRPRAFASRRS